LTFARSILLLAGIACTLAFVVFVGHALSTHESRPVLLGSALLGIGVVLLVIYARTGRAQATESGDD
jgi:hypothetical protein